MPAEPSPASNWRFGVFTYDSVSGVLRKGGTALRLQDQPRRVLEVLLARPGEVVTRQELQDLLWPEGVNVDFDTSLNAAVRRLRQVLLDDADRPRYIETIPRKGYRFIAPVERVQAAAVQPPASEQRADAPAPVAAERADKGALRIWAAVVALLLLAAVVAAVFRTGNRGRAVQVARASILIPSRLSLAGANGRTVAIADDGQTIAYSAADGAVRRLYIRPLGGAEAEVVAGSEGALTPLFVPGQALAWTTEKGVYRSAAGAARALTTWTDRPPASTLVTTARGDLLFNRIGADADVAVSPWILRAGAQSAERLETQPSGPGLDVQFPQQIVDDRYLIFSSNRGPLDRAVMLLDRESRQQKVLVKPAMGGRLLPNGRLLYFWNHELLVAPFDRESLSVTAPGVPVLSGVSAAGWTGANADLSSNGTLVYVPARPRPDMRLVWVDLHGRSSPVAVPSGPLRVADLSADGRRLLLVRETGPDMGKLIEYDLSTGSSRDLVSEADSRACWSPDAKRVAFSKAEPGESLPTLHVLDVATGRTERVLPFQGNGQFGVQWTGARMVFVTGFHPKTQIDIWTVPGPDAATAAQPVVAEPGMQTQPRLSPDGRWIAYVNGFPDGAVEVRPVEGGSATQVAREGAAPVWSADGRWIYYRSGARFLAAPFSGGSPSQVGTARVLFEGDYVGPTQWLANTFFDQAHGRFLLAVAEREADAPEHIEVITNWMQEISRR